MTQSCAQNPFAPKPIDADYDTTRGLCAITTPSPTRTAHAMRLLRVVSRNEASVGSATAGRSHSLRIAHYRSDRVDDDDIDVLVEASGGTTTARTLVETTLHPGEDAEDKLRALAWLAFVVDPALIAPTSRTNRL